MPCFIILFSLDVEDPWPPRRPTTKHRGTHQQSQQEDAIFWLFPLSSQ